jgi:hypothetical protein
MSVPGIEIWTGPWTYRSGQSAIEVEIHTILVALDVSCRGGCKFSPTYIVVTLANHSTALSQ